MKTLIFTIFFQLFIILINFNSVYSQDIKSYHVVKGIGYIAVNNDSALQDYLSRNLGVTLSSEEGVNLSGLLAMNKKGGVLADKKYQYGSDPGNVEYVCIAGDNGWWRTPNASNAIVLIEMLKKDKNSKWREIAAIALGQIGSKEAIETLKIAAKSDSDTNVKTIAQKALENAASSLQK
jgi:hypothetical protein